MYFKGFSPRDIIAFGEAMNPAVFEAQGIHSVIRQNPLHFYLLYRYAELPTMARRGQSEPLEMCTSIIGSKGFDPDSFDLGVPREEGKGIVRWELIDSDTPLEYCFLIFDRKKRRLLLTSSGLIRYTKGRKILQGLVEVDTEPRYRASNSMTGVIKEILKKDFPGFEYLKDLQEKEAEAPPPEPAALNKALHEYTDSTNYGKDFDLAATANKYGIDRAEFEDMLMTIKNKWKDDEKNIPGGIAGLTPPPPAIRKYMTERFVDNRLFTFRTGAPLRRMFKEYADFSHPFFEKKKPRSLEELPRFLEDFSIKFWKSADLSILNYTFYLLSRFGEDFRPLRDYGTEYLKIFYRLRMKSPDDEKIENFLLSYGDFCALLFAGAGYIDIGGPLTKKAFEKAAFTIRTTDFFQEGVAWDAVAWKNPKVDTL